MYNIGRLEEVNIRELWVHEQYDFSRWMSKKENISLLNETVGLTLTDIETEVYVGPYRCDLVAIDETTDIKVVIENQLDSTNHDHLGKIITYASGLDAKIIIWIVKEAREEHKSAIEWLNNNMAEDISFFLIEVHAYRIGNSLPAPKFEIIEKPNDFVKSMKSFNQKDLTRSKAERLNFWNKFNDYILKIGKPFNVRKASTDNWYNVAIGTSEAHIKISLINNERKIVVELTVLDNKKLYDSLYLKRDLIEEKLGFELDWNRMNDNKVSRIAYFIYGLDYDNQENYESLMQQIVEKVLEFRAVFSDKIPSILIENQF